MLRAIIEIEQSSHRGDEMSQSRARSKAEYDRNRLFHTTEQRQGGVTQTTTVTVTIQPEPKEGCFEALKACFGLGVKAAKAGAA